MHATGAGPVVFATFAEQSPVLAINALATLLVTSLPLTTIPILGTLHTASNLTAYHALSTFGVVFTHLAGQALAVTELAIGAIPVLKAFDTTVVEAIANLSPRTTETVLLGATVTAFVLQAGPAAWALVVVAAAVDTFTLSADIPIAAMLVSGAAINANARLIALSPFTMLT